MAAQEHGALVAERGGDRVAQLTRADQADALEHWYAIGEDRARVVYDAHGLTNLPERDARRGVDVCDGADVRSSGIDARVDPQLGVRLALTRQALSVRIEDKQAVCSSQGRAGAGREQ